MVYHSMHNFEKDFITNELELGKEEFGGNFLVAYGLIARGIQKNESLVYPSQLRKDLEIAKQVGIGEIILYRAGGFNKKYAALLKKCSTS